MRAAPYKGIPCAAYAANPISERSENLSKTPAQLQQKHDELTAQLEQEKRKLRLLENRKSYLESVSRRQRAHRLITRGAAIESVLPELKVLTEQEFFALAEQTSLLPSVQEAVNIAVDKHNGGKDGG